jgi:membrane-associated phospholipid phosphatase
MRWFAACTLCAALVGDARGDGPSPYRLKLEIDLPVLVAGTALWAGTAAISDDAPPPCGTSAMPPCDPSHLNAFDRAAVGLVDPTLRLGANITGALPAAMLVFDVFDAGITNWRSWAADLIVIGEALAWDGAIQDLARRASRRPRPFLYVAGAYPFERDSAEAARSFYSGHTAFAFTLATSLAYTFHLRHPRSRWRFVVWPVLLGVATIEPILRVLAGDHFPTDVIVGALVGSALGVLFPALHRAAPNVKLGATASVDGATFTVALRY